MFEDRIKTAACDFIELDEAECEIYAGSGLALAVEVDGKLRELVYAGAVDEDQWKSTLDRAFEERVWLVRCSTYTLCQPLRLVADDTTAFAKAMRLWGEENDELLSLLPESGFRFS